MRQGDKLLVATSAGTLRIYQVQEPNGMETCALWKTSLIKDELEVSATLLRTVEKFARKIEQLAIIKELGILVALAGSFSAL